MRIDVELDANETALFCLLLGAGTGSVTVLESIDEVLALVNKLMALNPDFVPYRVNTPRTGA